MVEGFTILEILITAVLLAALVAIVLPAFSSSWNRMAPRHAADEFRATHALARSIAIRNGRVTELRMDATNGRFWVEIDTSAARIGVTDTIGVVKDVSVNNVTMTSTHSYVCFDGRGLATTAFNCPSGAATVVFSRGARADTVDLTALGKVLR